MIPTDRLKCACRVVYVGPARLPVVMPSGPGWEWLPSTGWSFNPKGYPIYTSRSTRSGIPRGAKLHRLVVMHLHGDELGPEIHVHHMDFDKRNACPGNLLVVPRELNTLNVENHPYTGRLITREEFNRITGRKE
jgi:hypothetical protein